MTISSTAQFFNDEYLSLQLHSHDEVIQYETRRHPLKLGHVTTQKSYTECVKNIFQNDSFREISSQKKLHINVLIILTQPDVEKIIQIRNRELLHGESALEISKSSFTSCINGVDSFRENKSAGPVIIHHNQFAVSFYKLKDSKSVLQAIKIVVEDAKNICRSTSKNVLLACDKVQQIFLWLVNSYGIDVLDKESILSILEVLSSFYFSLECSIGHHIDRQSHCNIDFFYKKIVKKFNCNSAIIKAVVHHCGIALEDASLECKNNIGIALTAYTNDCSAIRFISNTCLIDKRFISRAIPVVIQKLKDGFAQNINIIKAVDDYHLFYQVIQTHFPKDRDVLLSITVQLARLLQAVDVYPEESRVPLYLFERDVFHPLMNIFKSDRAALLQILRVYGMALLYVCDELRADRELCLLAAMNEAAALMYASEELQKSRHFVLRAVQINEDCMNYVEYFQNDDQFIQEALEKNALAVKYVNSPFSNKEYFKAASQRIYRSE